MNIRKAKTKDITAILQLLSQVLEIHASIRPDIFISGSTKYTEPELLSMLDDPERPVYVAVDEADKVLGYVFCCLRKPPLSHTMQQKKTFFIDDLCVDERYRGLKIGEKLFRFAASQAKETGCAFLTLNVWEGNDAAMRFYKKMGMKPKETEMELSL